MDPILFCSKLIILTAAASKVSWKSRTNLFKRRRKRASRECNKTIRIDFIRMRNIARYAAVVAAVVACTAWPPILLTAFEATMCMPECKANIALHSLSFSSFLFFFFGFPRFYWELGVSAKSVKIAKIHCDDGKWRCRARKSRNYSFFQWEIQWEIHKHVDDDNVPLKCSTKRNAKRSDERKIAAAPVALTNFIYKLAKHTS